MESKILTAEELKKKWEKWSKKYPIAFDVLFCEDEGRLERVEEILKREKWKIGLRKK